MIVWSIVIMLVLVVVNGFFVGLEFALVGSRRPKLEALAAEGNRRAHIALEASGDLTMLMAGAQLGVTMASLGIGFFGEPTFSHLIESALEGLFDLPHGVVRAIFSLWPCTAATAVCSPSSVSYTHLTLPTILRV